MLVDFALLQRQPGLFRKRRQRRLAVLRRHPHLGAIRRHLDGAIHRFHRRVGEKRRAVHRFDFLRRARDRFRRVAFLPERVGGGSRQALLQVLGDGRARLRCVGPFVPDDRQRVERGLRMPPRIGDDGDGRVVDLDDAAHAGPAGDLRLVVASELAAEHRALLDRGTEHAGLLDVDRVHETAVQLRCGVQPLDRLAGDLPFLRILERDGLRIRRSDLGRRGSDLAVARRSLRRRMRDHAVAHADLADRHLPLIRRRLQ